MLRRTLWVPSLGLELIPLLKIILQRFRREVQLAKDVCDPLQVGLQRYATELGGRLATKGYEIEDGIQSALRQVDEEITARRKKRVDVSSDKTSVALGEGEEGLTA